MNELAEYDKQTIINLIEIRKYLSTYILVLTGGMVGLALSMDSALKVVILIFGVLLDAFFINGLISCNYQINSIIKQLKAGG